MKIKNIAIAGAGGLGSFLSSFLFNYGAIRNQFPWMTYDVDIYDNDIVEPKNLLHQDFQMGDIGKRKAEILADKYMLNPIYRFMGVDEKGQVIESDFDKYDLIFSCVDNMTFRRALYEYGWAHPNLAWIDGRCNSKSIAIYNHSIPQSKLSKTLTKDDAHGGCLRRIDKENEVSHATPLIVAGIMTQFFLDYLRGELPADEVVMML